MTGKVDHVGIAVDDLDAALRFWSDLLGLRATGREEVESEGVRVAFLSAGPTRLELLEPTREDSALARALEKRGPGIHHMTLEVSNLGEILSRVAGAGLPMLDREPRSGAEGRAVAFLHPRATGGVLLELVEGPCSAEAREDLLCPGRTVLAYLREPQEKLWGVLRRMDAAGVVIEGIDLASYDDWVSQLDRREESVVGPSVVFVPMLRLEKILLDRSSGHLPSLAERFRRRLGRTVQEVLVEARGRGEEEA